MTTLDLEGLFRSFSNDGFVVLRNVISRDKLSGFRDALFAEFAQRSANGLFSGGGRIAGHLNCYPGEIARFAYDELGERGVIDLVRRISPEQVGAMRLGCNLNFPKSVPQNYHLDGLFSESFLIVNVAVVDTDLVNGAIDVIPRTHLRPYEYWQFALGREYRRSTRVPMQQGDVLVRKSTLWHRGMPNRSSAMRPMLAFTFGEDCAPTGDPFAQNGGKILFEPNRFRTNWVGQIREHTFVKVPLAHSAIRFVQSLLGKDRYVA